jgi:hypothetical protein
MNSDLSTTAVWVQLEQHFAHHAFLVNRFRGFGATAVAGMWQAQENELGSRLSSTEREALVERYCELFGRWPT